MPADAVAQAFEVVPCVDVVTQSGEIESHRPELLLEARGAPRAIQRLEVSGIAERERISGPVGCRDDRRRCFGELFDVARRGTRQVVTGPRSCASAAASAAP